MRASASVGLIGIGILGEPTPMLLTPFKFAPETNTNALQETDVEVIRDVDSFAVNATPLDITPQKNPTLAWPSARNGMPMKNLK